MVDWSESEIPADDFASGLVTVGFCGEPASWLSAAQTEPLATGRRGPEIFVITDLPSTVEIVRPPAPSATNSPPGLSSNCSAPVRPSRLHTFDVLSKSPREICKLRVPAAVCAAPAPLFDSFVDLPLLRFSHLAALFADERRDAAAPEPTNFSTDCPPSTEHEFLLSVIG